MFDRTPVSQSRVPLIMLMTVLGLATVQSHGNDLSYLDLISAGGIAVAAIWSLLEVLRIGRMPRPLFVLLMYEVIAAINLPLSLVQGAHALEAIRRGFVIISLSSIAKATFFATWGNLRRIALTYFTVAVVCTIIAGYNLAALRAAAGFSVEKIREVELDPLWYLSGIAISAGILTTLVFPILICDVGIWWLSISSLAAFSMAALCLLLSFSRTSWAVTPIVLFIILVTGMRVGIVKSILRPCLLFAGTLVLTGIIAEVAVPRIASHSFEILQSAADRLEFRDESGAQRAAEAAGIFKWLLRQPSDLVTGWGIGNEYEMVSVNRSAVGGVGTIKRDFSHDYWLLILMQTGLVGLVLAFAFIWSLVQELMAAFQMDSVRHAGRVGGLAIGLLGAVLQFVGISFTIQPFGMLLWNLVFGVIAGLSCSLMRFSVLKQERQTPTLGLVDAAL